VGVLDSVLSTQTQLHFRHLRGFGVAFSPDGADIAVAHFTSPHTSQSIRGVLDSVQSMQIPATVPTGNDGYGVAFSPDGADIALTHATSPYISAYPWSSGFGTKYANPATLPTNNGRDVAFSPRRC
jgi:DNA-binding beta-propeller fold protein YncE